MTPNFEQVSSLSPLEKRAWLAELLRKRELRSECLYPLSYGQKGLWFLCQDNPDCAAYHVGSPVRLRSTLDGSALRSALQELVSHHPSLRTTFSTRDGEPVQQAHSNCEICFENENVSGWSSDELNQRILSAYRRPFDLERGPVLRANLFTRTAQDHVLLITQHHIVSDFWSTGLLSSALPSLYAALKDGQQLPPHKAKGTYADFVRWQSEMLASPAGEQLSAYWRGQLAGELPILNLSTDRPRPPLQTYRGNSLSGELSDETRQQLKGIGKSRGATLYMTLAAAFQVLLHRYTGQDDILIGSLTSGRSRPEFSEVVGYFANPVVLRGNLSGDPSFADFLVQMRQTVLDALAHQDYPFPLLVQNLQPARDPGRSPIFQVTFAFRKALHFEVVGNSSSHDSEDRLQVEPFAFAQEDAQFDLTLEIVESEAGLRCTFKYNCDLFDAETIARMAGHFQTLLAGIIADPLKRVSALPILPERERHQMQVTWNATRMDYPSDKCVHQLFEAQVEQTPDAIAVIFGTEELTYRELNNRANHLANCLNKLGVGPDVLVGLFLERSFEMLVGLLGTLKAGGAYVPLDPNLPRERLSFMVEDARVAVILTQERFHSRLPPGAGEWIRPTDPVPGPRAEHGTSLTSLEIHSDETLSHMRPSFVGMERRPPRQNSMESGSPRICLDAAEWGLSSAVDTSANPISNVSSGHLAYVIYTSGSTGKSKGVEICHRGVVNCLTGLRRELGFVRDDIFLSVTTLSFDIAALELFLPLITGARLVLSSPAETLDGLQLVETMTRSRATFMQATPATWRLLLECGWAGHADLKILCGGEPLSRPLARDLTSRCPAVWNMYGPTETTIWSACRQIRASDEVIALGRPIANTEIYIVDSHLQLVPIGVPGELHIGGAGLARGYLNRPDLTQEKFIPNPFKSEAGARLYKTGDLARFLSDGNLVFAGRIDHQVKIRGYRVELGEIESALNRHPSVASSVVAMQEDHRGEKCLIAYVVMNPERRASEEDGDGHSSGPLASELRTFLRQYLPEIMVPSRILSLDRIPLTTNGKVDRKKLPAPVPFSAESNHLGGEPRNTLEHRLVALWEEVLRRRPIGVHQNFFDLGGHSLLLARVQMRLSVEMAKRIPMAALFQYPSISALAEYLERVQSPEPAANGIDHRTQKQISALQRQRALRKAIRNNHVL